MADQSLPLHGAYDDGNIFAKILRREIQNYTVYEDEQVLVFMDIMPQAPGHVLVVPKAPSRNLIDIAEPDLLAVVTMAAKVARAAARAFAADGVALVQFSGSAVGQTVPHTHFHVVPKHADGAGFAIHPASAMAPADQLAANAQRLKQELAKELG